jgi:hypothetical protein
MAGAARLWQTLERYWKAECQKWEGAGPMSGTLHLAQAQSNRGPRGRKKDFVDAERLLKRLVAQELIMSFVPDAEQRLWRTVVRRKYQLTCDRVRLQNQLESLLEEAQLKLSSLVSDLLSGLYPACGAPSHGHPRETGTFFSRIT